MFRSTPAHGRVLVLDAGQLAAYITDDGNLTSQQVQQWLPTLPPMSSTRCCAFTTTADLHQLPRLPGCPYRNSISAPLPTGGWRVLDFAKLCHMMHSDSTDSFGSAPPEPVRRPLRVIAGFEAVKGFTALAASIGLLGLLHRDLRHLAEALIGHVGLNPGSHYPAMLLRDADMLGQTNLQALLLAAVGYALVRHRP